MKNSLSLSAGGLMAVVVTVAGAVSTSTLLFSYDGPVVLDALERSLSLVLRLLVYYSRA